MNEKELYKQLRYLTINKDKWYNSIDYIGSLLTYPSLKIRAKVLWLLGEFGLKYPKEITPYLDQIAELLNDKNAILRSRAINALGRIGRADFIQIYPYWERIMKMANDEAPDVRLYFIWASENIATNTPQSYKDSMEIFCPLLDDVDDKVRMEAPEIFRVLAKRIPQLVNPYLEKLKVLSEHDNNRVVRVHANGAIKAYMKNCDAYHKLT